MLKNIVTKAQELIKAVEGLKGKTGPEKKAYVIAELCKLDIPFVPDWLEGLLEPVIYGFIVDNLVKWWNELTGHRLEEIPDNEEAGAVMADVVMQEVKAVAAGELLEAADIAVRNLRSSGKFDALMARYETEKK